MERCIGWLRRNNGFLIYYQVMGCERETDRDRKGRTLGEWLEERGVGFETWREVCRRVDVSKWEEVEYVPDVSFRSELSFDEKKGFCQLVVRLTEGLEVEVDEAVRVASDNLIFGRRAGKGARSDDGGRHTRCWCPEGEWDGVWDRAVELQEGV